MRLTIAVIDEPQAVVEMRDGIRVILYLLGVPTPRLNGVCALQVLDDHEVNPSQVLSVARERHRERVDIVEIRERAM